MRISEVDSFIDFLCIAGIVNSILSGVLTPDFKGATVSVFPDGKFYWLL